MKCASAVADRQVEKSDMNHITGIIAGLALERKAVLRPWPTAHGACGGDPWEIGR
jgi:hypothetical protein